MKCEKLVEDSCGCFEVLLADESDKQLRGCRQRCIGINRHRSGQVVLPCVARPIGDGLGR